MIKLSSEPYIKASYITPQGLFINLEENKDIISCIAKDPPDVCHSMLINYLDQNPEDSINIKECIKLNDGNFEYFKEVMYINFPKQVTDKQYIALLKWLDFVLFNNNKRELYLKGKNLPFTTIQVWSKANPDGCLPEDVIKLIRRLYNENAAQ